MSRVLWGVVLIVVGAFFALQTFGILAVALPFWSLVLTIFGLYLVVRGVFPGPFRWRPGIGWFKLTIGAWLASIGVVNVLHANDLTTWTGSDVWSIGWFVVLIGAGLALIFGTNRSVVHIEKGHESRGWRNYWGGWDWIFGPGSGRYRAPIGVGDLHYGRESWVLDRKLTVRQRAGDVRVDLTTAKMDDGSHDVEVHAGVGEVVVLVPDHCNAIVRARVGTGSLNVFGERRDGIGPYLEKNISVPDATVTLNIDVQLRVGEVSVRRVPRRFQEE